MASFEDYADFEKAKSTILTLLKEQFPNTHFQFEQYSENQFSYVGKLGANVFDDFTDHTMLTVTYSIGRTVMICVMFEKIPYNHESIYELTNAFNDKCLYGGMHISDGLPVFRYCAICSDTGLNLKIPIANIILTLPSLRSQINTITKFSK